MAKLSEKDGEKVLQYVKSKIKGDFVCSICKNKDWSINPYLFKVSEYKPEGKNRQVMPLVSITCSHCGNTLFVNAFDAGVAEKVSFDDKVPADNGTE